METVIGGGMSVTGKVTSGTGGIRSTSIDPENPLLKLDNAILTPHCTSNSREALETTSIVLSEDVVRIVKSQPPKNFINKRQLVERGYLK